MKRLILILILLLSAGILIGCGSKKADDTKSGDAEEVVLEKKYARYNVWAYKDRELTQGKALISKAEGVDLLGVEEVMVKNKATQVAHIRLSDDTECYLKEDALANRPVVFIEETRAHLRNNLGSGVYTTIPKGTLAFVLEEKGGWTQIWAGQIKGKWVTKQWVKDGFTDEMELIPLAKKYEKAMELAAGDLNEKNSTELNTILQELSESEGIFAELARMKQEEMNAAAPPFEGDGMSDEPASPPVESDGMRDEPNYEGNGVPEGGTGGMQ